MVTSVGTNVQMGGGSISYNERALSELEVIPKSPELRLIPHSPPSRFFRFPGNGIPSTRVAPICVWLSHREAHNNHSYDIDPISWMKIMSGPSQQRGGNSAGILLMDTDLMGLSSPSRSRAFDGHPQTRHAHSKLYSRGNTSDARRNVLISPEKVTSSYLGHDFGATAAKCLIRDRDGWASRNATLVIGVRGLEDAQKKL
ncbi:hypothetical protein BJV78DRAFT_1157347 [Lactifluus subvellereus]|nr:hypothetical protein BJV78DRAFT_1157347 [Lactifluus subvellereus]